MILKLKRNPIIVQQKPDVDVEQTVYSLKDTDVGREILADKRIAEILEPPEAQKELLMKPLDIGFLSTDKLDTTPASFTPIDKIVMHGSQWARHIYPTNKGDISWIFKTEKGMWFKIESRNNFFTVSYGHGNIHSESAHWVKTHTWRESKDIAAAKQREAVTKKFEQEKPIAIVQKAMDEDVI